MVQLYHCILYLRGSSASRFRDIIRWKKCLIARVEHGSEKIRSFLVLVSETIMQNWDTIWMADLCLNGLTRKSNLDMELNGQ